MELEQRTSRSDEGLLALIDSVFKEIFGLSDETASRMHKIIKNQGEWQNLKVAVRSLSGVAYRRLNDVITMAQQKAGRDEEFGDESEFDDESEFGDESEFANGHEHEMSNWDDNRTAREGMSFIGYLLTELQYSDVDLRDPQKKQEIMRVMRAGDRQAPQLITRAEKSQGQEQRQDIQQETDPRRLSLQRKKQQLQKQIAAIDQQLGEPGAQQPGAQPKPAL